MEMLFLKSDFYFLDSESSDVLIGCYPGTNKLVEDIWYEEYVVG